MKLTSWTDYSLLATTRGRGGGLRLLKPAKDIALGAVVRNTETDFTMVECFDSANGSCRLTGHCRLKSVLQQALQNYMQVLDGVTLADLVPSSGAGLPNFPRRHKSVKLALAKNHLVNS